MAMEINIEATDTLTQIDGVPVRHWKGVTAQGLPVEVFVHRVAVPTEAFDNPETAEAAKAFEEQLQEMAQPGRSTTIPLRHIL